MKLMLILSAALLTGATAVQAEELSGATALALAALVGENSAALSGADKKLLDEYLNGEAAAPHTPGQKIKVVADRIHCSAASMDITSYSCSLSFGPQNATLGGRKAHELFAILLEAGIAPEGSAGHSNAAVSNLHCLIDADKVASADDGGAICKYKDD